MEAAERKRQRQESRLRRKDRRAAALAEEEAAAAAERKLKAGVPEAPVSAGQKRQRQAEALGGAEDAEDVKLKKERKAAPEAEEDDELEAAEAAVNAAKAKLQRLKAKKMAAAKAVAEDENEDEPEEAAAEPSRRKGRICRAEAATEEAPAGAGSTAGGVYLRQAVAEGAEEAEEAEGGQEEEKSFVAFVGGLPSHVDESYIKRDFGECGKITNIVLARWPQDGSSKGIAFITFATESALNKCVEWNGEIYENKPLRIEKKEGKDRPVQKKDLGLGGQRGVKPEGCMAVAVLDMSKSATEEDLLSFFEKCGAISAVRILKHRETYESRGIAFVTFEDTSSTDKAVELSGKSLAGKPPRIEYAAPKNDTAFKGRAKGKGKGNQEKPEGCTAVVVRNLDDPKGALRASEADLWELFKGCPSASNVSILPGLAFVDFDDTNDTDVAVKLSGREIQGQAVSVTFKMPKR